MGLPDSGQIPRVWPYSGAELRPSPTAYGTFTLFGGPFQSLRLGSLRIVSGPTTPSGRVPKVWADPLSLAATHGVEVSFSSSRY